VTLTSFVFLVALFSIVGGVKHLRLRPAWWWAPLAVAASLLLALALVGAPS